MADELQNIILNVQNVEKLKELNKYLEIEKKYILEIDEAVKAGTKTATLGAAMQANSAAVIRDLTREMDALAKSSKSLASPQGLLQLSYIFDDLTNTSGGWDRKLASISNNLPGLFANIPRLAAFAGGLGLIGTAAIAAAPQVKALIDSFSEAKLTDAERGLDRLIKKAEEAGKGFERLAAAPTDDVEKRAMDALRGSISGANAGKVAAGFTAGLEASGKGEAMNSKEVASLDRDTVRRQLFRGYTAARIPADVAEKLADENADEEIARRRGAIRTRIKAANQAHGREMVDDLTKPNREGANARKRALDLVNANPSINFPTQFAADLANADPDSIRAADRMAKQVKEGERKLDIAAAKTKKKRSQDGQWFNLAMRRAMDKIDFDRKKEEHRQNLAVQVAKEGEGANDAENRRLGAEAKAEAVKARAEARAKDHAGDQAAAEQLERNHAGRLVGQLERAFGPAVQEQAGGVSGHLTARFNSLYAAAEDLKIRASRSNSGADVWIEQRLQRLEMMMRGGGNQGDNFSMQPMIGW